MSDILSREKALKRGEEALDFINAHSVAENYDKDGPWPATWKCKCGIEMTAPTFHCMQACFVHHIVMEHGESLRAQLQAMTAERERLLAERERLVAALHNLVKMPMMTHACSNVGDGCPVCRGREVLADAQQERT